ncbi:DUF445 family protein [Clostridium algidicarnis]|uniref:DUF445 family protein n=1 Tax=Clostridium algidicarnis TaxID=37659 RepID=UPI001C0C179A|nr:DUF445 family protein [Clostridium algidicarnis]MBU3228368.1 DUF445 family protein [Clostridium algidicarnis]MBU3251425.1 DUF445 family protein [Clostridium algidicarnis]
MKKFIPCIVGAVIGYITNWLAIKMLFRPYEEKRIFGIKVPFTPGLIPKEKQRIAKSVSEAIANHLLSKDTIVKALCSPNIYSYIYNMVETKIKDIYSSTKNLKDLMAENLGFDQRNIDNINENIYVGVLNNLNDNVKDKIVKEIYNLIEKELKKEPLILEHILKEENMGKISDIVYNYASSKEFHQNIKEKINKKLGELIYTEKRLKEVIPKNMVDVVDDFIYENRDKITSDILYLLEEPDTKVKIKVAISEGIGTNVNPLVAMFLNPETLYNKFLDFSKEYLKEDENKKQICVVIKNYIDKLMDGSVSEIIKAVEYSKIEIIIDNLVNNLQSNVFSIEVIKEGIYGIKTKLLGHNSIHEILLNFDPSYKESLYGVLKRFIYEIVDTESTKTIIKDSITKIISVTIDRPINSLIKVEEDILIKSSNIYIKSVYDRFIQKQASDVIEILNIEKIVEDNINSFEVDFAEEVIVGIAHEELKAITWLGALLGGLIGLVTPFLYL